jgi:hypothetical protein
MNRAAGTVELVGRVVYRDTVRELRADWANYLGKTEQLLARGSPVLEDLDGGATIAGDELSYLRESETRPVARMTVTGERTYAVIPPDDNDGAGADTAAVPMEVWASRMVVEGEELFEAFGDVELQRGEVTGGGDRARFDQARNHMTLTSGAHIENPGYRLEGERIDAMVEGETLREVRSERSARLISQDLDVRSERIRIGFVDGEIERLEAWNPEPEEAPRRALALARDFRMRADSIDVQADSGGVRELRAVGRAYGERELAETPDSGPPPPPLPGAIARDWIQGDTILGYFSPAPSDSGSAPSDTATVPVPEPALEAESEAEVGSAPEDQVVLERIVVVGGAGPALSLYRMASDDGAGRPSINFMKAKRIILFMEQGDVARVEAEGPIEGMYLTPGQAAGEGGEEPAGDEGGNGGEVGG